MAIENRRDELKEFLGAVDTALGDEWLALEAQVIAGAPYRKKKFAPERTDSWTSYGGFGKAVAADDAGPTLGLYVEPSSFSIEGNRMGPALLEASALLPTRIAWSASHNDLVAWIEEQVASTFPQLEGTQIVARYPNVNPRPLSKLHLLVDGSSDTALEKNISDDGVWVTIIEELPAPEDEFLCKPVEEVEAVIRLRQRLPLFARVVSFVQGILGACLPDTVDPNKVLGFCGEYLWFESVGRKRNATWHGGHHPFDFSCGEGSVEVKASVDAPPLSPIFSIAELTFAARAKFHRFAFVGVPSNPLVKLQRVLDEALVTARSRASLDTPSLAERHRKMSTALGIPEAVLSGFEERIDLALADIVERASAPSLIVELSRDELGADFLDALGKITDATRVPRLGHGTVRVAFKPAGS